MERVFVATETCDPTNWQYAYFEVHTPLVGLDYCCFLYNLLKVVNVIPNICKNDVTKSNVGMIRNVQIAALVLLLGFQSPTDVSAQRERIMTVQGPIEASAMGLTLSHEHIMSNFGQPLDETSHYNESRLFDQVLPYLKELRSMGVESIVDCTAAYFGRRVDILRTLADSVDIHVITNTGIYGAANDKYIPSFVYQETPSAIAEKWVKEWQFGIDGTEIKPGFIKLAFDSGPPSAIDLKLFEAGILAHLRTGLPIAVHTGNNAEAVRMQLQMLDKYEVSPGSWIWVHANKMQENDLIIEAAKAGAWISLDGVKPDNYIEYVDRLTRLKSRHLLDRILLSHDGNGFPAGKEIRRFDAIMTTLIPALLRNGFTQEDIRQLMVDNPRNAFALRF